MRIRRCIFPAILLAVASAAYGQAPQWWVWAPKGTHVGGGPGQAAPPGALVVSPIETGLSANLSAVWQSLTNLTDSLNDFTGPDGLHDKQQKIIQEAIGKPAAGEDWGVIKPEIDPIPLLRRQQMLDELKRSPDAARYTHFIAYFETMQAHEARQLLFIERANTLIKANTKPMTWQDRVRLAAEVGILNTQQTLADQEAAEVYNRAVIKGSLDRLEAAQREAANVRRSQSGTAMRVP